MSKLPNWKELASGGIIPKGGTSIEKDVSGWRTYRPVHQSANCIHCLRCWIFCPDSSIKVEEGKMVGMDLEHCKGCGICAQECPKRKEEDPAKRAIVMKLESELKGKKE